MLARLPSAAGCSALMRAVAAYPTTGLRSGNSARISEDRLPASRGRTLKVSIAFATVGLDSVRRAATWLDESGIGIPPWMFLPDFRLRGGDHMMSLRARRAKL